MEKVIRNHRQSVLSSVLDGVKIGIVHGMHVGSHVGSIAWNENGELHGGNQNSEGSHAGGSDGAGPALVFCLSAVVHVGLAGGGMVGGVQWMVFNATR
jgi:hypothetical protein